MNPRIERLKKLVESQALRPHGTRARYVAGRCRCEACREANRLYQARRTQAFIRGHYNPLVDAAPVRQHLHRLQQLGLGKITVSNATGLNKTVIRALKSGEQTKIRKLNAEKILAVDLSAANDGCYIPSEETWKKLDELIERGYTKTQLARWLGCGRSIQFHRGKTITARNALRVSKLYNDLESGKLRRD